MTENKTITFSTSELLDLTDKFFKSIESSFNTTLKYKNKDGSDKADAKLISSNIVAILGMVMIIPAIPLFVISSTGMNVSFFDNKTLTFIIIWILQIILYAIIFKLILIVSIKLFVKRRKVTLSENQMLFGYLYKSIKEIESYIENNGAIHIETARQYISCYFNRGYFKINLTPDVTLKGTSYIYKLHNIIDTARNTYDWLNLDDESAQIIESFSSTSSKIVERLWQSIEVDRVIPALQMLLIYEYSRIKQIPETILKSYNLTFGAFQKISLLIYATELSQLSQVGAIEIETKKKNYIKTIFFKIRNGFTSDKILICFFTWYVMFQILTLTVLKIGLMRYKVVIDSTILVALVSIPVLGAAAISGIISSNKK